MKNSLIKLFNILSEKDEKKEVKKKGQVYLFIIAINDYFFEEKLNTCKRDSDYLLNIFLNYSNIDIKKKNIYSLFDREATKIKIFDQLKQFNEILNEEDNLILHFCGHSASSLKTSFIIPSDGEPDNIYSWISSDLLTSFLKLYRVQNSILILNACSSISSSSIDINDELKELETSSVPKKIDSNLYSNLINYLKHSEDGFKKSIWHFSKNISKYSDEKTFEVLKDNTELNEYFEQTKKNIEGLIEAENFISALEEIKKISINSDLQVKGRTTTLMEYIENRTEYNKNLHRPLNNSDLKLASIDLVNKVHDCGYYLVPISKSPLLPNQEKKHTKIILFSAANTEDNDVVRLDEEYRAIDIELMMARKRDEFELIASTATRISDLQRKILTHKPYIVHFSGHGKTNGICMIQSEKGDAQIIENKPLGNLFNLFSEHIKCVFLNSCHSIHQSTEIAKYIDYVVCMNNVVKDTTSIKFASSFYTALGNGESINFSYKFAKNSIELEGLSGQNIPKLLKKS